ncbi:MAG: hypothetical protein HOV97_11180, partial [Nonomuraea sp.]|nr:hypothetical protein [Nonomuraea sp.]
ILAGLVGGMVMVGGSALAATPHMAFYPQADEDPGRVLVICGDDNILADGEVDNGTRGVLVLETGDILSQILGIKSEENKCAAS